MKRNLRFLSWVIAAALGVVGAGWYLHSKWALNNRNLEELRQKYAELKNLDEGNVRSVEKAAVETRVAENDGIDTVKIGFRAVGLNWVSPAADKEIAFEVLNEIRSSEYFDASKTMPVSDISPEVPLNQEGKYPAAGEPPGTFSFKIVAKLKRPLKL
jgi:hypothetical protein